MASDSSASEGRTALRAATDDIHRRLHEHPAFLDLAAGRIDLSGYRTLLCRLHGFHVPLEEALVATAFSLHCGIDIRPRRRAELLRLDLSDLGLTETDVAALPRDEQLPALTSPGRFLGGLYVKEGSTLGGRILARQLDHILPTGTNLGRRFLADDDPHGGSHWRACCAAFDTAATLGLTAEMAASARAVFAAFESWFEDLR